MAKKIAYAASSALTMSLAGLGTDANLLAGQEATAVDNSSNLYFDYQISGKITTGTSPTAAKQIEIYVVAPIDPDTPTWPDVFTGTNGARTITSAEIKKSICRVPAHVIDTNNTSDRTYPFAPISVASLFGGVCPKRFTVFVTHNTGVALNATAGNHTIVVQGIYATEV